MSLSALIRKGGLAKVANANPAKAANDEPVTREPLARLATLALANPQSPEPFDREAFEERAAIREFDGGYTRQEAERLAMIDLIARHSGTVH